MVKTKTFISSLEESSHYKLSVKNQMTKDEVSLPIQEGRTDPSDRLWITTFLIISYHKLASWSGSISLYLPVP